MISTEMASGLSGRMRAPAFSLTPAVLLLLSTCLYMSPALWDGANMVLGVKAVAYVPYGMEARLLAVLIVGMTLVAACIRWAPLNLDATYGTSFEHAVLAVAFGALLAYTLATPELFVANKALSLEATNRFHSAFYNLSILMALYRSIDKRAPNWLGILGCGGLVLAVFIGHRSYLAIALVGLIYIALRNRSIFSLKWQWYAGGTLALILLAIYKSIYLAIKRMDIDYVIAALSPDRIGRSMQIGMEQFLTFRIFDQIVQTDFALNCTNLKYFPLFFVPFTDSLVDYGQCSSNAQFQPLLFGHYTGGVASNIWAEFYATFGGIGGLILVPIVLIGLALGAEWMLRRVTSPLLAAGIIVAIVQLTFYVQRNDLITAFSFAKRSALLALALFLIAWTCSFLLGRRGVAQPAGR